MSAIGVGLLENCSGRNADDDVGEVAAGCAPHPDPPQLDLGLDPLDRLPRACLRRDRHAVHEHVDVLPDQPTCSSEDEHGNEERRGGVRFRNPGPSADQAEEHGQRAAEVAQEVHCVGGERRAVIPAAGSKGDARTIGIDHDHDPDHDEGPPGCVDLVALAEQA